LREADEAVRRFIQEDISSLTADLQKQEAALQRMKDEKGNAQELTEDINEVRKKIYSFAEFAKSAKPEVLVTLLQTIVERVYVTYEKGIPECHIFLKGCLKEDYSELFGTAEYIGFYHDSSMFRGMCNSERVGKNGTHLSDEASGGGGRYSPSTGEMGGKRNAVSQIKGRQ
jgi:hypothetical protein